MAVTRPVTRHVCVDERALESVVRPGLPGFICLLGVSASPVKCTRDPVLHGARLVARTCCALIDLASTLLCERILAYIPPPLEVASGSYSKRSSSVPYQSPEPHSSTKSSLRCLPPRSTYLGDIRLVRRRPNGFQGGQRGFIISIERAQGNIFVDEGAMITSTKSVA